MSRPTLLRISALLLLPWLAGADADDDAPAARTGQSALALSDTQRQAVGIVVGHPVQARTPRQIEAYGLVLDPVTLVTDAGRLSSTQSAARFAAIDVQRLEGLYRDDTNVSLKALQLARIAEAEAQAQAQAAAVSFALQWGPVAEMAEGPRRALIDALAAGRTLLVRADLPGQHALGARPRAASLTVDGLNVPARVLGSLARVAPDLQSAGWLLQVDHAPVGLGPGARLRVTLDDEPLAARLVPSGALLYGEQGVYVYRQVGTRTAHDKLQYAPVSVKLLAPLGEGWLVDGLADADNVVVRGAGVLWSLQGLGSFSAEEDEHD